MAEIDYNELLKTTDIDLLKRYAGSDKEMIRFSVAGNPNISTDILGYLLRDKSSLVRTASVRNPKVTTEQVLELLEKEDCETLFYAMARETFYDEEVYRVLAKKGSDNVKMRLGTNEAVPNDVIQILLDDDSVRVVNATISNPKVTLEKIMELLHNQYKRNNSPILDGITQNPNCSKDLLRKYATRSKDPNILKNVAKHPNTEEDVLTMLSKSLYADVRKTVALNENTPKKVLEMLLKDKNEAVKIMAQKTLEKEF